MQRRHLLAGLALIAGLLLGSTDLVEAQRSGRFELEYEGPVMGGVTGVGATYSTSGAQTVIELPAVVRSYPTVRFVLDGAIPERPTQAAIGSGASVRFSHPDLTGGYVGERGMVRITEVANGVIRGEFAIVAAPAGAPGTSPLTFRGRFEASAR